VAVQVLLLPQMLLLLGDWRWFELVRLVHDPVE